MPIFVLLSNRYLVFHQDKVCFLVEGGNSGVCGGSGSGTLDSSICSFSFSRGDFCGVL
eukprot:SAG11_NODE_41389_length_194_cov_105.242105_1_plen_57_part_01